MTTHPGCAICITLKVFFWLFIGAAVALVAGVAAHAGEPASGPTTVTCIDLCTGKTFEVHVDHPNTPGLVIGDDGFCLTHVQVKSCVTGEVRSQFSHPVDWTGGIWKSWFWWSL